MATVYKFGGTSVSSSQAIQRVHEIINLHQQTQKMGLAIVVSAMGSTPEHPKTTDLLLSIVQSATAGDMDHVHRTVEILRTKHLTCITNLLKDPNVVQQLGASIESELQDILAVTKAVQILKSSDDRTRGVVSGYGELWSARILHAYLKQEGYTTAQLIDARDVVTITAPETVDWEASALKLATCSPHRNDQPPPLLVITGFICSTAEGVPTTLGRNGSDYSATIFGRLLHSSSVVIWTDVSGVLSADPRRVPNAVVLPFLSYDEAMELAYFGANVLHPKAMAPATMLPPIPVHIRNTFAPTDPGSCITTRELAESQGRRNRKGGDGGDGGDGVDGGDGENDRDLSTFYDCARGFSTVDHMCLINVEGSGMIGVSGFAQRLFTSLHAKDISVTLIAQASSEHSICVAVKCSQENIAIQALQDGFSLELARGQVASVSAVSPCTILAVVGDALRSTTGVAGRFFAALGASKINVLAISQGKWRVVVGGGWWWLVVVGCGGLWLVVVGCGWLWLVVVGGGWLWVVVVGCGWWWLVVVGCGCCCDLRCIVLYRRDLPYLFLPVIARLFVCNCRQFGKKHQRCHFGKRFVQSLKSGPF
jgi:aspartokinase/homoserine dehydrogenase 1